MPKSEVAVIAMEQVWAMLSRQCVKQKAHKLFFAESERTRFEEDFYRFEFATARDENLTKNLMRIGRERKGSKKSVYGLLCTRLY